MPRLLKRPTVGANVSLGAFAGALLLLGACSTEPNFGSAAGGGSTTSGTTSGSPVGGGGEAATSSSGVPGDGGGGAASISASGPGVTSTVTSVTTGADCDAAADCLDGDPCTDDLCTDVGLCESTPRGIGLVGNPGEGACEGVCQTDGSCGYRVFSRPFFSAEGRSTWEVRALSELWGTRGSPPFRDIVAVEHLSNIDYLIVFTSGGLLHIRDNLGLWQPGVEASTVLPALPSSVIASYSFQPDMLVAELSLTIAVAAPEGQDLQQAYLYEIDPDGGVIADPGNPFVVDRSDEAGAPPASSEPIHWSFAVQTAFPPTPSWVVAWEQSGAGVFSLDGGSAIWTNHGAAASSPLWQGMGTPPPPVGVVAAWFDGVNIHFVAP